MAEPWRPPGSLPADVFTPPGTSRLNIVTGPPGCGKTTWCRALLAQAHLSGVDLRGVLCPAIFADGEKTAIDVVFLGGDAHGRHARLAEQTRSLTQIDRSQNRERSSLKLAWDFDAGVMRAINEHFASIEKPANLLIDEIGPLELIGGGGWQSAVSVLDAVLYRNAFVVVRPSLLHTAVERWCVAEVIDVGAALRRPRGHHRKAVLTLS